MTMPDSGFKKVIDDIAAARKKVGEQPLCDRLLCAGVKKKIAEELGNCYRQLCEFAKGMSENDANAAKIMVIQMMSEGAAEFFVEMLTRIETKKVS